MDRAFLTYITPLGPSHFYAHSSSVHSLIDRLSLRRLSFFPSLSLSIPPSHLSNTGLDLVPSLLFSSLLLSPLLYVLSDASLNPFVPCTSIYLTQTKHHKNTHKKCATKSSNATPFANASTSNTPSTPAQPMVNAATPSRKRPCWSGMRVRDILPVVRPIQPALVAGLIPGILVLGGLIGDP